MIDFTLKNGGVVTVIPADRKGAATVDDLSFALNHMAEYPQGDIVSVVIAGDVRVFDEEAGPAPQSVTAQAKAYGALLRAHIRDDREPIDHRGMRVLKPGKTKITADRLAAISGAPAPVVGGVSMVFRSPARAIESAVRRTPRPVKAAAAVGAITITTVPTAAGAASLWYSGALVLFANEHVQAGVEWLVSMIGG